MHIRVMPSLGDAIYCRPFVRAFASSIETKWPDLFRDFTFAGVAPESTVAPFYRWKHLQLHNIVGAIGRFFPPIEEFIFDLPEFQKPLGLARYAVIRPPMLRKDFYAPARNPRTRYIDRAAQILGQAGYVTVGVAHAREGLEWFDEFAPSVDVAYWRGELSIPELMGLVSGASVVVGGPGWQVAAALAYGAPLCIVYGGAGAANRIEKLTDPRIDCSRVAYVAPDSFCLGCRGVLHDCDKLISGFDRKFVDALARLSVRV